MLLLCIIFVVTVSVHKNIKSIIIKRHKVCFLILGRFDFLHKFSVHFRLDFMHAKVLMITVTFEFLAIF